MDYERMVGLNKPISRMVFGCDWIFANTDQNRQIAFRALDDVASVGCNAFDTAHIYCGGESERALGLWMQQRANREQMVVLSKCCHHNQDRKRVTPFDIQADLHDSLARLQTSYIDIYLLHRDDPTQSVGPIVETLNRCRDRGQIRAFGGSNWTHERLEQANEYAAKHNLQPFTASSPNFSLAEQVQDPWGEGCVTISGPQNADARRWYRDNPHVRIFAYSSLARGLFSGRISAAATPEQGQELLDRAGYTAYFHPVNLQRLERAQRLAAARAMSVAQIATAYVMSHELRIFALQAPRTLDEMRQNQAAIQCELTPTEMSWLDLQTDTLPDSVR